MKEIENRFLAASTFLARYSLHWKYLRYLTYGYRTARRRRNQDRHPYDGKAFVADIETVRPANPRQVHNENRNVLRFPESARRFLFT